MAIPDEDVAQVRAATDIVGLIGEHAALRHQGRRWVGLCPFHAEKTPSFSVNAEEGFYYCFGCQASGDAISFVRAVEHLDFVEAVRLLADRAGVAIHEDAGATRERKQRTELLEVLEKAVVWYHERLLAAPDAGRARDYLRSRGYDGDVVRQFRLGWAPAGWDELGVALGVPDRVLAAAGLGFVNRRGRVQDSFRARIIFPICDPSGHPVALGGRILPPAPGGGGRAAAEPKAEPKYKNSQESAIYSKRRTLYALNWAKKDIIATNEVIVCEGYTDVIGFFTVGLPRAVATCGTALGEEHFTLLRNFAKRIILAYDADSAGQSAVSRVYEWERRHEVDVAVARLPTGSDPGELARTDPDALRRAVDEAQPFLQFRVDRALDAGDLQTVEGRARAADLALSAVAEHPDDFVRDQYVMQIADRCRLEPARARERLEEARRRLAEGERTTRDESRGGGRGRGDRGSATSTLDGGAGPSGPQRNGAGGGHMVAAQGEAAADGTGDDRRPPERARAGARRAPGTERIDRPGMEALRFVVHRPEDIDQRLESVLFVDDVQRRAFLALAEAENLRQAVDEAPPDVADLLRRLAVEEPVIVDDPLTDPAEAVTTQLVREASRRALGELQAEARIPGTDMAAVSEETSRVRRLLEELDDPQLCRDSSDRLLAWLLARGGEGG